ncbi:MAG: DUF3599 family protein [Oscillospiraceae bacterium]
MPLSRPSPSQSETFDDYSYTAESSIIDVRKLGVESLLDDYVVVQPLNGVTMRLRASEPMAIEDFFDHRCSIYQKFSRRARARLRAPGSQVQVPQTAGLEEVPCHFGVRSVHPIAQQQPQNDMDSDIKLTLPAGTDIRLNDKIVSSETGLEYTAGQPRNIRGHHMTVKIYRTAQQRPL